ncbi:MAG: hypothetical protein ABW042_00835 [Phenylobacterium sp.]
MDDWPPTDTHSRALAHLEENLRAACLLRCAADQQRMVAEIAAAYADARIAELTRHIAKAESHRQGLPPRLAVPLPRA